MFATLEEITAAEKRISLASQFEFRDRCFFQAHIIARLRKLFMILGYTPQRFGGISISVCIRF